MNTSRQFRQVITTNFNATVKVNPALQAWLKEMRGIKLAVEEMDGQHVVLVDVLRLSPASASLIVDDALIERVVTPVMYIDPPAFRRSVANGKMLPDKKRVLIGNLQRELVRQQQKGLQSGKQAITNRKDYIAIYNEEFNYLPKGKMGNFLNRSTSKALKRR